MNSHSRSAVLSRSAVVMSAAAVMASNLSGLDAEDRSAVLDEMADKIDRREVAPAFAGTAVVDRDYFRFAVNVVKHAAEKRATVAILSNVLLVANSAGPGMTPNLSVVTTNMDMEIKVDVPAAVDAGFGTTLPADMLDKFLRNAPKSEYVGLASAGEHDVIEGTGDNRKVVTKTLAASQVEFDGVRYGVNALPVASFPVFEAPAYSHSFTMAGAAFRDLLAAVETGISTEETRYYLNGIYFHAMETGPDRTVMRAVTTDGHRLYRQEIDMPDGAEGMPGVILPRALVQLVGKLMRGKLCPDEVEIAVASSGIRITFDRVTITSKVVDGTFPDYQRVIPTSNATHMEFDVKEMLSAVGAVSLIATERGRAVRFDIGDASCRLSVVNPDAGTALANVACVMTGDEIADSAVGLNAMYLASILEDSGADRLIADFRDTGSPVVFRKPGDDSWIAVQMPMRI